MVSVLSKATLIKNKYPLKSVIVTESTVFLLLKIQQVFERVDTAFSSSDETSKVREGTFFIVIV